MKTIDWFCCQRPSRRNVSASGNRHAVAIKRMNVNSVAVLCVIFLSRYRDVSARGRRKSIKLAVPCMTEINFNSFAASITHSLKGIFPMPKSICLSRTASNNLDSGI
jgi:hypothetical protein